MALASPCDVIGAGRESVRRFATILPVCVIIYTNLVKVCVKVCMIVILTRRSVINKACMFAFTVLLDKTNQPII